MLDISIKELKKALSNNEKRLAFMWKNITVTEKFDGTKLTLVRNDKPFDEDYRNNWIVSYKGFIIFPGETQGLGKERLDEVRRNSIGVSQYMLVHEHLRKWHNRAIQPNLEFFVEFIQNKPTLTRDYDQLHDLFLIGYANTSYSVNGIRLFTMPGEMNVDKTALALAAGSLGLKLPPVLFEGPAADFGKVESIISNFSNIESVLGGKAEGVVIRTDEGDLYKVVATDQYNKEIRKAKKERFALSPDKEKDYWTHVKIQSSDLIRQVEACDPFDKSLATISTIVYSMQPDDILAKNSKKSLITLQDDLFLTTKLRLERFYDTPPGCKKIAFYPMAGKPVHSGHWKMIKNASESNDRVYLFVSLADREGISGAKMLRVWNLFLMSHLPSNVIIRFCDSPVMEVRNTILAYDVESPGACWWDFSIYTGADDDARWAPDKLHEMFQGISVQVHSFDRKFITDISGTQMRQWLTEGNEKEFCHYLPECLDKVERQLIYRSLHV